VVVVAKVGAKAVAVFLEAVAVAVGAWVELLGLV